MIQVIEGKIKQYSLPKVGTLKDGSTVSGYHLLDENILKDEGWLPLEDNPPEYDEETQYLQADGYEILKTKAKKKYKVVDIPEPEPDPVMFKLNAVTFAVQKLIRVDELEEGELEEIIGLYDKWDDRIGTIIKKDELVRHEGELYKSLAEHTADENFNPIETNYRYVLATPKETIDYWRAPAGYQDVYNKGDVVIYKPDGKTYISKIDGNSQEPTMDEPHNRYWELKE